MFQHLSYDAPPNLTHVEDALKLRKSVGHHPTFREKGTYVMPIVTLEKMEDFYERKLPTYHLRSLL